MVRFLLEQAAKPSCPLSQLVVIAAERHPSAYISWISPGRTASLPHGRLGIVDCFSDPSGWKAAWSARRSDRVDVEDVESRAGGKVHVTRATRDGADNFAQVISAVESLASRSEVTEGHAADTSKEAGRRVPKFAVLV